MKELDLEKADEIFKHISDDTTYDIANDHFLLITADQYAKYLSQHDTSSMSMELFSPKNYGIVLQSSWKKVHRGDIVFFAAMRGHNLLLHENIDVGLKLLTAEDYLMKKQPF